MKKYIFIDNAAELLDSIACGKRVEGVLFKDKNTGCITFKAYQRKAPRRRYERLLCHLEHGWVKESPERIKFFESIPKVLGIDHVVAILNRETKNAGDALIEMEMDGVRIG
jgi:hypothetical protein